MQFFYTTILVLCSFFWAGAQNASLEGVLIDGDDNPVGFANVAIYKSLDNSLFKVETTNENGEFKFQNVTPGVYNLEATFVGFTNIRQENISLIEKEEKKLGKLTFQTDAVELETAVVTAKRAMVEVKPDRTVFNVEGTINSAGDNGLGLLRKAPGVLVDNNNNISVLSRSGVLVYVDGRRLPITGDALTAYLENLPAEQIDRIDIITNPGAKYEAQGNAGIIDIRLKKDKNLGANASLSGNFSQGRYTQTGLTASGNYRNKNLNTFATIGTNGGTRFNEMEFLNFQNGIIVDETNFSKNNNQNLNLRWGTDFFVAKNHTVGFLVSAGGNNGTGISNNTSLLSPATQQSEIDSILIAENSSIGRARNLAVNLNYKWETKEQSVNVDADYGTFDNYNDTYQPNLYFGPDRQSLLTSVLTSYETPVTINISTFKIDYEKNVLGGKLGLGTKLSNVATDNTFLFYDIINGEEEKNIDRSNEFFYDENVYAAYLNYARPINDKWNFSAGLRTELTDSKGDLRTFNNTTEPPVEQNYLNYFPTVGLTYKLSPMNTLSLNYGSRINRPDYNVLNPFRAQLSELSFRKGNAFLQPEIVHNVELGYTLFYRFNFKLAYSRTNNQITRLIGPDDVDLRAGFITWENLATQTIYSFNASLPFQFNKWWSAYLNASASRLDNQAVYDDGGVVDIQAFTYNFFQQHTFTLGKGYSAEVSGWFSGPGVWGGVFRYNETGSLNLGLQKKFFADKLNVKLSANDILYTSGWNGSSEFNGLVSSGAGRWDSRRVSLALSYNFGNKNVKSRKRKTGLEDESKRVSTGG